MNANIHDLFKTYDQEFFGGDLKGKVSLEWSERMTQCAGKCYQYKRSGLCTVRLSHPLLKYRSLNELYETLLHELIHAWLFITKSRNVGRDGHGPDF